MKQLTHRLDSLGTLRVRGLSLGLSLACLQACSGAGVSDFEGADGDSFEWSEGGSPEELSTHPEIEPVAARTLEDAVADGEESGSLIIEPHSSVELNAEDSAEIGDKIFGANSCKDVKIAIANRRGQKIDVHYVKYFDLRSDRWRKEDLKNATYDPNITATWTENLGDTLGHFVTDWAVYFKSLSGGSWSALGYQSMRPSNGTWGQPCQQGMRYDLEVR